jgi:hypothetical protein
MNDTATAVEYYKNALDHVDQTDPYAKSDTTYYQDKLKTLQGGQ